MLKLTTIGMYEYDPNLFADMLLPDGVDRELVVNTILLNVGEMPVLYASIGFMRQAIGIWSKKWLHSWERMNEALLEEYNALHNFDRNEEYSDVEDTSSKGSSEVSTSTRANQSGTSSDETKVSAYNSDAYQPSNATSGSDTATSSGTSESETSDSMSGKRSLKHIGHLYGNIGVTESTTMLQHEIDLRSKTSIYDIIADMYKAELCIPIY